MIVIYPLTTCADKVSKSKFETLEQVRQQTRIWMNDYNNHRPHQALGNLSPIKYASCDSFGTSPKRITANNYIEKLEL